MIESPLYLLSGLVGLIVGSYLNVLILRFGTARRSTTGRSVCPHCSRTLSAWELIPLVSFVWLRGRCRTCHQPISWQYPTIELLSALGSVGIVAFGGSHFSTLFLLMAFWTAVVIGLIDLRHMLIPDLGVLFLAASAILWQLTRPGADLASLTGALIGALVGGGIFAGIVLLTRGRGMGWGDPKLGAALGILLGWPLIFIGVVFSVILGALIGMLLILSKVRGWRDPVPFGPFLLVGASLGMIWGETFLHWLVW